MKPSLQPIATDIYADFLNDISLWTYIGNTKNVNKLKILRNSYLNNKSEFRHPKIGHVLLVGRKGSGKTTNY